MPICHAASLLEHRCSLIQHGNLAVLPRGERSKQNDTLGYRVNLTVLYVDMNVMYLCTDTDTHFISASDPISNPNPRKLLTRCTILTGSEILLEYMTCSYKMSLAEFAMWKKSTNSSDITTGACAPELFVATNQKKWISKHTSPPHFAHIFLNLLFHLMGVGGFSSASFEYILVILRIASPSPFNISPKFSTVAAGTWGISFYISETSSGLKSGAAETCKANKYSRNESSEVELFQI